MKGVFELLVNGKLETYHSYEDIPEVFDNVIKFLPDIPPPPHSEEQHEGIELWNKRLQELIEKEKKKYG
jgi:hypothetical protein